MDHQQRTPLATILVVLTGLLVACSQSSTRLGWVEASSPGSLEATYAEFTGMETRTVPVQPGKTLYLEYDAEVRKGALRLEVDDPLGETIWCAFLCDSCGETKVLPVNRAGCYTISVQGETTEGGFELQWEQR
ncbi:hypothetical protein ACFLWA_13535 [Chloroflexota bacterium]